MKYTIEQLNDYSNLIVCHLKNKDEHKALKKVCPEIENHYSPSYKYYLCSAQGYAQKRDTYEKGSFGLKYKIIEFEEIEFEETVQPNFSNFPIF